MNQEMNQEDIKNKVKENLAKRTDPIMDDALLHEKVQMPEEVFKGRYLDSFIIGGTPESIKEFASVAGGYRNEVDIVDSKGVVIFTTPPMLSSPDFSNIGSIKETDLSGIGKETQQKINSGHFNPTKEFDTTINSIGSQMLDVAKDATKVHSDRWKLIFSRYSSDTMSTKNNIEDDVEFNYDD